MNLRLVLTIINALILPYLGWAADQDDEQHVRRERTLAWVGGMCAMAFDARLLTNEEASGAPHGVPPQQQHSGTTQDNFGIWGMVGWGDRTAPPYGDGPPRSPSWRENDGLISEGMQGEVARWLASKQNSARSSSEEKEEGEDAYPADAWLDAGDEMEGGGNVFSSERGSGDDQTVLGDMLEDEASVASAHVIDAPVELPAVVPVVPVFVPWVPEPPATSLLVADGDPLSPYVRRNWLRKGMNHWFILYDFSHWGGMKALCLKPIMQLLTQTSKRLKRKTFLKWRQEIRSVLGQNRDAFLEANPHLAQNDVDAMRMLYLLMCRKRGSYMRVIEHPLI